MMKAVVTVRRRREGLAMVVHGGDDDGLWPGGSRTTARVFARLRFLFLKVKEYGDVAGVVMWQ